MAHRWAISSGFLAVAILAGAAAPRFQTPGTRDLVASAAAYVAKYQQEFAYLIADEAYQQTWTIEGRAEQERQLTSEFFLTYLPVDNEWLSIRDFVEVDGKTIGDRATLPALLAKRDETPGLIGKLVERNAQYNIGNIKRTFNEPTLPLLLLGEKRVGNVDFDRRAVTTENGVTLATLGFVERGRPTLVRIEGASGFNPASGEIVIEVGTGVIRRTSFEMAYGRLKVRLITEYARDPKLGLWLPALFTERYDSATKPNETIFCRATYTNYRRFETTGRIRR
jgi:hypothetical protein